MDISNFIVWFINQFFTILGYVFNALDYITIAPGVTLFDKYNYYCLKMKANKYYNM